MTELLSSATFIQEETPQFQSISGVSTSVGMIVGVAEKGPIGVATLITSAAEFTKIFGSAIAAGYGAIAVQAFFQGGGTRLYFVRTVHYTNIDVASSKTSVKATRNLQTGAPGPNAGTVLGTNSGPFDLEPGDTLELTVDGAGPTTATFTAVRASVAAGNAATYALSDGMTLLVKIDQGPVQTITFLTAEFVAIGAATTAEVNAVINAKLSGGFADVSSAKPQINSDTRGTGSYVEITGGTANTALGFSTSEVQGTGNVADIDAVTVAEVKTVVEAAVSGVTVTDDSNRVRFTSDTTGASSSVLVGAASTADDELGVDNATHSGSAGTAVDTLQVDGKYDGEYGNAITILITDATSGVAEEFNLSVLVDGVVVETFPNLTMDDAADRYVESVINHATTGSDHIAVVDLDVDSADASLERPANSPGASPVAFGPLTGGDDGLSSLDDNDFIGSDAAKTGLHAFDTVQDGRILFVPDRATPAVSVAMLSYCEVTREGSCFAVLEPPEGLTAEQMVTYTDTTAALVGLSGYGAIYWPRVKIVNPNKTIFGSDDTIVVPNSPYVAACYARVDASKDGGVYVPPGGIVNGRLLGVVGLETDEVFEKPRRDLLYPKRINPINKLPGQPIAIDGVRTLQALNPFPTVAERRGMIFIEQSIKAGIEFARLRNNDEALRDEVDRTVTAFLLLQMAVSAFRTKDPTTAFFVDAGNALNPPSAVFAGKLTVRVGVCTQKPAEFVIISFSQDTRALDTELAAAAG